MIKCMRIKDEMNRYIEVVVGLDYWKKQREMRRDKSSNKREVVLDKGMVRLHIISIIYAIHIQVYMQFYALNRLIQ